MIELTCFDEQLQPFNLPGDPDSGALVHRHDVELTTDDRIKADNDRLAMSDLRQLQCRLHFLQNLNVGQEEEDAKLSMKLMDVVDLTHLCAVIPHIIATLENKSIQIHTSTNKSRGVSTGKLRGQGHLPIGKGDLV